MNVLPLNIEEEQFEAYKSSIKRARWFNLTVVLLSSLILFHLALEKFGYSASQLRDVLLKRAAKTSDVYYWDTTEQMEYYQYKLKELADKKESTKEMKEIMDRAMRFPLVQNQFSRLGQPRTLPLLGLEVPANDYFPLMAVMLTMLTIALWLNVRSVLASVKCLLQRSNSDELKALIRLHFTFTSLQDHPAIIRMVQIAAIWLPFAAGFIGIALDMAAIPEAIKDPSSVPGPWGWRLGFLVLLEFVMLAVTMASTRLTLDIDREIG